MSDSPQTSRAGLKRRSGEDSSNASPVPTKRSETSSSGSIPSNSASPNEPWLDDDDVCIMLTPTEVAVRVQEAEEHAKLICDSEYAARIAELEAKHAAEKIEMSIKFDRLRTKMEADHRRELDTAQQKLSSYKTALEQTSKVKKELLDDTHADSNQGNWAAREDALRAELHSRHRVDLAQKDAEIVGLQADLQAKGQRDVPYLPINK